MQYRGYTINYSSYGCVVINPEGERLAEVATDADAYEFVDCAVDNALGATMSPNYDVERIFVKYCKKLPGVVYPDNFVLATSNMAALNKFINQFKKKYNVEIHTSMTQHGDELLYCVDSVECLI